MRTRRILTQPYHIFIMYQRRKPKDLTIGGSFAFPPQTQKKQMIFTTHRITMQIAQAIGTMNVMNSTLPIMANSMFSTVNLSA